MAFVIAGLIALATLAFAGLQVLAAGMSDWTTNTIGFTAAALIAVTHWLPHIGW